jgi:hypothetical protein
MSKNIFLHFFLEFLQLVCPKIPYSSALGLTGLIGIVLVGILALSVAALIVEETEAAKCKPFKCTVKDGAVRCTVIPSSYIYYGKVSYKSISFSLQKNVNDDNLHINL